MRADVEFPGVLRTLQYRRTEHEVRDPELGLELLPWQWLRDLLKWPYLVAYLDCAQEVPHFI